ncbi:MAG: adenosylcobinamide-GDP ribazoletransferase [Planctomycetota bacterium]
MAALGAALRLLVPGLGRPSLKCSAGAVHWLVPGGLLIGLLYVGLFRASWRIFGEVSGVRLMPALAVWLVDVVLFGQLMLRGAAGTIDKWAGDRESGGAAAMWIGQAGMIGLFVLLILKLGLWTALPAGVEGWPGDWRRFFNFAYPRPVLRPLILAPVWGRWGMILAAGIGRTAPAEGGPIAGLSGARSPAVVLGWFLPVLGLSAIYCGRHGRWMIGCIIGLAVLGVTFLFSVVSARRFSGHTRFTVYAAGLLSEIAFLVFYLAASQRIYY